MRSAQRALAAALSTVTVAPVVTRHTAQVSAVTGATATVTIDGSSTPVAGVPVVSGLALAAGQTVTVELIGRAPRIIARLQ